MTVEVEADDAQQAEETVRQSYKKDEYILDAENFTGVEFSVRRSRDQKRNQYER